MFEFDLGQLGFDLKLILFSFFWIVVLYILSIIYYISNLLVTPPHYTHRKPKDGLAKTGRIIDPIWGEKIHNPKEDFGLEFNEIEFQSKDGNTLRGWHIPAKPPLPGKLKIGFVTVHGGGRDRREFHRFEPFINEAGYEMILFDYREHGISDGSGKGLDWGRKSYRDVLAAAGYAKQKLHWDKVICMGVSNGAVLSIVAAGHDKTKLIDGVIAESPYLSPKEGIKDILEIFMSQWPFGLRYLSLFHFLIPAIVNAVIFRVGGLKISSTTIATIDKIQPRPVLLIHGTADNRFKTRQTEELFKKLTHKAKEIWLVEGGKHTEVYDTCPKEYQQKVLNFANQYFQNPKEERNVSNYL